MSDLGLDPSTLGGLTQGLSDVQQRMRRAQQLRGPLAYLQNLQNLPATGNDMSSPQSGSDPTVQQYQPDYAKASNDAMSSIGQYLGQQQSNTAQNQSDQATDTATLNAVQQATGGSGGGGGGPVAGGDGIAPPGANPLDLQRPTNATIRAYLSLIGAPDMKDIIGTIPHVSSKYVGNDGYVHVIMSDGSQMKSGEKSNLPVGSHIDETTGQWVATPKSTAELPGGGYAQPVAGGAAAPTTAAPTTVTAANAGVPTPPGLPKGLPDETNSYVPSVFTRLAGRAAVNPDGTATPELINAVVGQESSGDPTAQSAKNAVGLMGITPVVAKMFNAGDLTDPTENRRVGTAYLNLMLKQFNGDIPKALAAYNAGPTRVQNAMQPPGPQAVPVAVTAPATGTGPTVVPVPNAASQLGLVQPGQKIAQTPLEKAQLAIQEAGGKKQAETDVENLNAPTKMTDAAAAAALKEDADNKQKLQEGLPGAKDSMIGYLQKLQALRNHPGLQYIVGANSIVGNLSDHQLADGSSTRAALAALNLKDPNAANQARLALNLYNSAKADSSFQGLGALRGSLSRATQMEWQKEGQAQSMLTRDVEIPDFQAEIDRMGNMAKRRYQSANNEANAPVTTMKFNVPGSKSIAAPNVPAVDMNQVNQLLGNQ
jgi:hypothetical protein